MKIIYHYFLNILRYFWLPILATSIAAFTFINRNQFQNKIVEHRVVFSDPVFDGKLYNNYYHDSSGYVVFLQSTEKLDVVKEEKANGFAIAQWVIFGASMVTILIWVIYFGNEGSTITSNLEKRITFGLSTVEVDDGGEGIYVCKGRIVGRISNRKSLIIPNWSEFPKISSIKFLPKFYSKSQNRVNNLNKIGV